MAADPVPPHNPDAERAVLGAVLTEPGVYLGVAQVIRPRDFYSTENQTIALGLARLAERGILPDPVLLREELERGGELEKAGGPDAILALADAAPTAANVEQYARIVREHAVRRRAIDGLRRRLGSLYHPNGTPLTQELRAIESDFRDLADAASDGPGAARLAFRTPSEIRASPHARTEWIVEGLIALGGVTLLAAGAKIGKTTFIAGLLRAVERGEEFIGFPTTRTGAVYLSEEGEALVCERCATFGIEASVFLTRERLNPALDLSACVEEAVAEAKRRGSLLIVIDTWARFAQFARDAEKDASATEAALRPVLAAAAQGLAVLLVHHHRKTEGEDGTQVRGSGALHAGVDALVELRRPKEDGRGPVRLLEVSSRYREAPTEALSIELRNDRYIRLGVAAEVRMQKAREKVIAVLQKTAEPMTREEIQEAAGGHRAGVGVAIRNLAKEGVLMRIGKGKSGDPFRYFLSKPIPPCPDPPGQTGPAPADPPVPPTIGGTGDKAGGEGQPRRHPSALRGGTGNADPPGGPDPRGLMPPEQVAPPFGDLPTLLDSEGDHGAA